jgi:hyperosmotically inducible protein
MNPLSNTRFSSPTLLFVTFLAACNPLAAAETTNSTLNNTPNHAANITEISIEETLYKSVKKLIYKGCIVNFNEGDITSKKTGTGIEETLYKSAEKQIGHCDMVDVVQDDIEISNKIKIALSSEHGLQSQSINVSTINGVVTLTGSVDLVSDFDLTRSLAESVDGVIKVENRLRIRSAH